MNCRSVCFQSRGIKKKNNLIIQLTTFLYGEPHKENRGKLGPLIIENEDLQPLTTDLNLCLGRGSNRYHSKRSRLSNPT